MDLIFDDLKILRPTALGAPPIFWESLYRQFQFDLKNRMKESNKWNKAVIVVCLFC